VVPGQQFRLSLDNQAPAAASISARQLRQYRPWTILDRDDHLDVLWSTGLGVNECVAWNWSLGWKGIRTTALMSPWLVSLILT
jgi:hypothetical protein